MVAAAVMIALVLHVQKDKFLVYAQENGAAVAFIVLLGSTVALAYNAVHNMLLKRDIFCGGTLAPLYQSMGPAFESYEYPGFPVAGARNAVHSMLL